MHFLCDITAFLCYNITGFLPTFFTYTIKIFHYIPHLVTFSYGLFHAYSLVVPAAYVNIKCDLNINPCTHRNIYLQMKINHLHLSHLNLFFLLLKKYSWDAPNVFLCT